jgi:hypothetical protein
VTFNHGVLGSSPSGLTTLIFPLARTPLPLICLPDARKIKKPPEHAAGAGLPSFTFPSRQRKTPAVHPGRGFHIKQYLATETLSQKPCIPTRAIEEALNVAFLPFGKCQNFAMRGKPKKQGKPTFGPEKRPFAAQVLISELRAKGGATHEN